MVRSERVLLACPFGLFADDRDAIHCCKMYFGTEYRVKIGSAVTLPTDLSNGTTSCEGVQVKEVERSESVASRDVTVR